MRNALALVLGCCLIVLATAGCQGLCNTDPTLTLRMPIRFGADPIVAPTGYGLVQAPQMMAAPSLVYPQAPAVQYAAPANPCAPACAPALVPVPQYQYAPVAPPAAPPPSEEPKKPCPPPPVSAAPVARRVVCEGNA